MQNVRCETWIVLSRRGDEYVVHTMFKAEGEEVSRTNGSYSNNDAVVRHEFIRRVKGLFGTISPSMIIACKGAGA